MVTAAALVTKGVATGYRITGMEVAATEVDIEAGTIIAVTAAKDFRKERGHCWLGRRCPVCDRYLRGICETTGFQFMALHELFPMLDDPPFFRLQSDG